MATEEVTGPINLGNPTESTILELATMMQRDDQVRARRSFAVPLPEERSACQRRAEYLARQRRHAVMGAVARRSRKGSITDHRVF